MSAENIFGGAVLSICLLLLLPFSLLGLAKFVEFTRDCWSELEDAFRK